MRDKGPENMSCGSQKRLIYDCKQAGISFKACFGLLYRKDFGLREQINPVTRSKYSFYSLLIFCSP